MTTADPNTERVSPSRVVPPIEAVPTTTTDSSIANDCVTESDSPTYNDCDSDNLLLMVIPLSVDNASEITSDDPILHSPTEHTPLTTDRAFRFDTIVCITTERDPPITVFDTEDNDENDTNELVRILSVFIVTLGEEIVNDGLLSMKGAVTDRSEPDMDVLPSTETSPLI